MSIPQISISLPVYSFVRFSQCSLKRAVLSPLMWLTTCMRFTMTVFISYAASRERFALRVQSQVCLMTSFVFSCLRNAIAPIYRFITLRTGEKGVEPDSLSPPEIAAVSSSNLHQSKWDRWKEKEKEQDNRRMRQISNVKYTACLYRWLGFGGW